MDTQSSRTLRSYQVYESIGSGGQGTVYKAHQASVQRDVAIKIILPQHASKPDFIRRFENEAQLIARLEHPHIVPLYDYWRDPDGAYLVMRWLPSNLCASIKRGAWSLKAAAQLLDQVAAALSIAHREGIIHRDIKPSNILLDEDQNVYVADFGIALDLNLRIPNGGDEFVGSAEYASPEALRSQASTTRTDLYSLGYVMYEVLTGDKPFPDASTSSDYIRKHLSSPLPMMSIQQSGIPAALDEVLQTATAKDPAQRYASVERFAAAFRAAIPHALPRISDQPLIDPLTERELDVLYQMMEGLGNAEIAEKLFLSPATVKWYVKQIYSKLDTHNRQQTIDRADSLSLLDRRTVFTAPPADTALVEAPTVHAPVAAVPDPVNPYKGLRPYRESDAADFFGRAALTELLLSRLSGQSDSERLLVVVGPSGSGKSSVVRAGLIPALRRGALRSSPHPFITDMQPGTHPFEELEAALLRVAITPQPDLLNHLLEDRRGLVRAVKRILPSDPDTELILLIDQFEELFTLVEDPKTRAHFIDNLMSAVTDPRSRMRVILTLRADFYDRPLAIPRLAEMMRGTTETVIPLTPRELEQAITAPAERLGMRLENWLVTTILGDVGEQPGTLPLLQYAMTELFERREGLMLTLRAYQKIGGVTGALAQQAEELYQSLDAPGQAAVKQMMLRLVTLGEGVEDTRRRALEAEILGISGDARRMEEVIDMFVSHRLLTVDRDPITRMPTVEIAHEALLREWRTMRGWLNDNRDHIRIQRRLAVAVGEWRAARESGFLATGARLQQFEAFAAKTELSLTPDELAYLDASLAERERTKCEEAERQAHERQLEQRAVRFLRITVILLSLIVLSTGGLSIFAIDRERQAQRQADVNHSLVLANDALDAQESGKTELGLILALEAYNIADPPADAERALRTIADALGIRAVLPLLSGPVTTVAFSPDSQTALAAGCAGLVNDTCSAGELVIFAMQTSTEIQRLRGHDDTITSAFFTADGRGVWSASADGSIALWDISTIGRIVHQYPLDLDSIQQIALSPDGTMLLAATESGVIAVINPTNGTTIRRLSGHESSVNAIAFSPDGQSAISGGADGQLILWDVSTGGILRQWPGHTKAVLAIAFHPDGQRVVSTGEDFTARLWDVEAGAELQLHRGVTMLQTVAVQPDGSRILVDNGGSLLLINTDPWSELDYLFTDPTGSGRANTYDPISLAFDRSGQLALSGLGNGTVIVWTMARDQLIHRYEDPTVSEGIAFDLRPDGQQLISGTVDMGEALIWDTDPQSPTYGTILTRLAGHQGAVFPILYSPDGRTVLIGSGDWYGESGAKSLFLWNVDESSPSYGTMIHSFEGLQFFPRAFAFTPDGHSILVGTQTTIGEGELVLWDAQTGEQIAWLESGQDVSSILVSPDGKRAMTVSAFVTGITEWSIDQASPAFGQIIRVIPTGSVAFDLNWGPAPATFFLGDLDSTSLQERDYQTGQVIRSFVGGGTTGIVSIDSSQDQRYVITSGDNGELIQWEYASGREIWRAPRQASSMFSLDFRPDGSSAFSITFPGIPSEWNTVQPTLTELLTWIEAHRYRRDFTCAEHTQYNIEPLCSE